jgi:hypothetical protein
MGPFYHFNKDHLPYNFYCNYSEESIINSSEITLFVEPRKEVYREDNFTSLVISFGVPLFGSRFLVIPDRLVISEFYAPIMWDGRLNV